MRSPLLTTSLSLAASIASANPGALLSTGGSIDRPGDVLSASVGEDGAVTLAGLFYRVGETRVPGVIRLRTDGHVDDTFSSGIGISPPVTAPLTDVPAATVVPCPVMLPLRVGEMMLGDPPMGGGVGFPVLQLEGAPLWFVLGDNGAVLRGTLLSVTPQEPVLPQFVEDGKLVAIVSTRDAATQRLVSKVRRLRMDTGSDDAGFAPDVAGIPAQAAPAAGGGMWVLENDANGPKLARLTITGARSEGVAMPVVSGAASLISLPEGRAAVSSQLFSWDPVTGGHSISQLQFLQADGTAGATRAFAENITPFSIAPDGSVLVENSGTPSGQWKSLSRELADGTQDVGFHPVRTRRMLQHLADGKMLSDGTKRYLSDGTKDPAWSAPEPMDHGIVRRIFPGPGGTVYGTGDFTQVDGAARPGIARWLADGTLDASFSPAAAEGEVLDCAPSTDGTVAVLRRAGEISEITRLLPDGRMDRVLARREIDHFVQIEPWSQGAVLAQSVSAVGRISQTGEETMVMSVFNTGPSRGLYALPDGRFFANGRLWNTGGSVDWSFTAPGLTGSVPLCSLESNRWLFVRGGIPTVLRADGSVEFDIPAAGETSPPSCAAAGPARTFYFAQHGKLTRHYADGRRDPSFREVRLERRNESIPADMPLLSALQNGGSANAHAMLLHPVTGALWVAGDFTRVNGSESPGLAVISAAVPNGFAAWSAAISAGAADGDPDADGVSNWHEYAAGTDPLLHDALESAAVLLSSQPLCLNAPLNPNAPEVIQVAEVSSDLRTWRTAGGGEAVRKTINGSPAFELAPAAGPRFVRIRYRAMP